MAALSTCKVDPAAFGRLGRADQIGQFIESHHLSETHPISVIPSMSTGYHYVEVLVGTMRRGIQAIGELLIGTTR